MGARTRAIRCPSNERLSRTPCRGWHARSPDVTHLLSQLVGFARQLPIQERALNGGALDLNFSVASSTLHIGWSLIIWSNRIYGKLSVGPNWSSLLIRLIILMVYCLQFWLDQTVDHISDMYASLRRVLIGFWKQQGRRLVCGRVNARSSCSRDDDEGEDGVGVDDGDGLTTNPPASALRYWWRHWGDNSRSVMLCFCDITPFKSPRTWLRLFIMVRWSGWQRHSRDFWKEYPST